MLFKKKKKNNHSFTKKEKIHIQKILFQSEKNTFYQIKIIKKDLDRNNPYIELIISNKKNNEVNIKAFFALGKWHLFKPTQKLNKSLKILIMIYLYKIYKGIYSDDNIAKKIYEEIIS